MGFHNYDVAVTFTGLADYPRRVPFHPPQKYPEYRGTNLDPDNQVYHYVRETLRRLGLDRENFNTPAWNPLKEVIEPGMMVFVKPNTVRHFHIQGKNIFSIIIHASVMRPMLDYINIALNGKGRIVIGDAQVIFGHFDEAMAASQIDQLVAWYREQTPVPIELFDLRIYRAVPSWMGGERARAKVEEDPRGYTFINLGQHSHFEGIDPKLLRINIASHKDMLAHHGPAKHEYLFPNSVLQSDAVISIPKFKTHRRTAVTMALKNHMGLPALKDTLPHFMLGSPKEGGDQYPNPSARKRFHTWLRDRVEESPFIAVKAFYSGIDRLVWHSRYLRPFQDNVNEGMWYGNDTLWRTLLDVNRTLFYSDKEGKIRDTIQKRYFCLMDGIVGGEGDGPISCDPVTPGVLLAGFNPVAFDAVGASLMGFDIDRIPLVKRGLEQPSAKPLFRGGRGTIRVIDGDETLTLQEFQTRRNLKLAPHPNWAGHLERA
ncbi:MAG: DUF362 domain-containing protein [Terriglobales bacterium]|jgi:uncharacterized protein (DUF362 family)